MKEVITVKDIQEMFGVGYNKACGYIAAIKLVSDTLGARAGFIGRTMNYGLRLRRGIRRNLKGVGYVRETTYRNN